MNKKLKSSVKRMIKFLLVLILFLACAGILTNLIVVLSERKKIVSEEAAAERNAQCILILGAGVWNGNTPSPMLADRLDEGLRLYELGAAPKILVSGDHGQENYDEVNVMRKYLMDRGVPEEDIFMDHAGFSTYESMYRAKAVFGVERMIVVTQRYHMYRALYIADQKGIEVCGVPADPRKYRGALIRNLREMAGRSKDTLTCIFNVKPTYLGETIDITGDGRVTCD